MQLKIAHSVLLLVGYLLAIFLGGRYPEWLNGSLIYLPTLLLLSALGLFHYLQNKTERWLLLGVAGLFMLSLTFRTLDQSICPQFPSGTHFLWHISCAVIVYLATRVLILNFALADKR